MSEALIQGIYFQIGPPVPPISLHREYKGGPGNDSITGSKFNDRIYGLDGNDTLYGEAGNDTLVGGNGNDVLWGGTGADKFVFDSLSGGIDRIQDYSYSQGDRIQVNSVGFGATSTNQFNYNSNTGALFFLGTQFATIENRPTDFSTIAIEILFEL